MKRKIFALCIATAMTLSSFSTAFAADIEVDYEDENGSEVTSIGTEIGGGSDSPTITMPDRDITKVTLPAKAPNFVMDPTGVYAATQAVANGIKDTAADGTADPAGDGVYLKTADPTTDDPDPDAFDAYMNAKKGGIYVDAGNYMQVTNKGANDILVDVSFLAASEGEVTPTFSAAKADVTDASKTGDNKIWLGVTLNATIAGGTDESTTTAASKVLARPRLVEQYKKAKGDPSENTVKNNYADPGYNGAVEFSKHATAAIALDDKGKIMKLGLPGDNSYAMVFTNKKPTGFDPGEKIVEVAGDKMGAGSINPSAQGFLLEGAIDPEADWSSYSAATNPSKVTYKVVFNVKKAKIDTTKNGNDATAANAKIAVYGADGKTVESYIAGYDATAGLAGDATSDGATAPGIYSPSAAAIAAASMAAADTEVVLTFTGSTLGKETLKADSMKLSTTDNEAGATQIASGRTWSDGTDGKIDVATGKITVKKAGLTRAGITPTAGTPIYVWVNMSNGKSIKGTITVS